MSRTFKVVGCFVVLVVCFTLGACCPQPNTTARYLCFGDSVTKGDSLPRYPQYLEWLLGQGSGTVANEGKSGETAGDGRERLETMMRCDTYPNVHTVLYLEGANGLIDWIQEHDAALLISPKDPLYPKKQELRDLLEHIKGNVTGAVRSVTSTGRVVIIGSYFHVLPYVSPCSVSPLGFFLPYMADHINDYVDLLNEKFYEVAAEQGLEIADIATTGALYGDPANFLNCNHPSASGNEIIAGIFYEAICD